MLNKDSLRIQLSYTSEGAEVSDSDALIETCVVRHMKKLKNAKMLKSWLLQAAMDRYLLEIGIIGAGQQSTTELTSNKNIDAAPTEATKNKSKWSGSAVAESSQLM